MTDLALDVAGRPAEAPVTKQTGALLGLPPSMPLVLDLDGTLIAGDLLYTSFFSIFRRNPAVVFNCALWLLRGRAVLKRQLALRNRIDWDHLQFHQNIVTLARHEHRKGRRIILATAADAILAGPAASFCPFIDQVFASDGERNLKGSAKAELLVRAFPGGFIYAGDSKSDLAVWARAAGIVLVNVSPSVRKAARAMGRPVLELRGLSH